MIAAPSGARPSKDPAQVLAKGRDLLKRMQEDNRPKSVKEALKEALKQGLSQRMKSRNRSAILSFCGMETRPIPKKPVSYSIQSSTPKSRAKRSNNRRSNRRS